MSDSVYNQRTNRLVYTYRIEGDEPMVQVIRTKHSEVAKPVDRVMSRHKTKLDAASAALLHKYHDQQEES